MKSRLADDSELVVMPSETSTPAHNYVTVYTFVRWDHDRQATVIYPRMATPKAIAMMRGKINEDSAWIVDASELDAEGFYSADAPLQR
jgi:hypothetical protein